MLAESCSTDPTPRRAGRLVRRACLALTMTWSAAACSDVVGEASVGEVVTLASPAGVGSGEPNLATGPDGRVYLSWIEPTADSAHALRFAVLGADGWSEPRTIARGSDWFVNWADFPAIVPVSDTRLVAHYLQKHPTGETYHYDVRLVQSEDAGRSWSAPVAPYTDPTPAEHGFVSYYVDGDSVGVVWLDGRKYGPAHGATKEMSLATAMLGADGGLSPERILDGRVCDCCQTAAAMTAQGPVVLYRDRSGGEVRDIHVTRRTNGEWTEGQPLHRDGWRIDACPVNGPAIDARGDTVVAAWFTAASELPRVQIAYSTDSGESFSTPVRVDDGSPAGRVGVLLLPGGDALVSWLERTSGEGARVQVRRVAPDTPPRGSVTVAESTGARASGFPRMARHRDGVVFAWTEPGPEGGVRVARASLAGESR